MFWNNLIENNTADNAWEEQLTYNSWNNSIQGNTWSDFNSNPGYPHNYEIPGPSDGIDWMPTGYISTTTTTTTSTTTSSTTTTSTTTTSSTTTTTTSTTTSSTTSTTEPTTTTTTSTTTTSTSTTTTTSSTTTTQPNNLPYITSLVLNSTYGTNYTTENITAYVESVDPDGDDVTNIYNWMVDDQDYAVFTAPFDTNDSSQARDYSSLNLYSGIENAHWTNEGKIGGAYEFDGNNSRIFFPYNENFNTQYLTVEAWIKPRGQGTGTAERGYIASRYVWQQGSRVWTYRLNSDNRLFLQVFTDYNASFNKNIYSTTPLSLNQWHHVAGVYGPDNISLYIDGELDNTQVHALGPIWATNDSNVKLRIGFNHVADNGQNFFNGTIDELKIYGKPLNPAQIKQRYLETKDGVCYLSSIVAQETEVGQEWMVQVTANDGIEDGFTQLSDTLTVLEAPTTSTTTTTTTTTSSSSTSTSSSTTTTRPGVKPYPVGEVHQYYPVTTTTLVNLDCGDTITTNVVLGSDVANCTGAGVIIGASGITLNCNNHVIAGPDSWSNGVLDQGFDNVKIKNCVIEGFNNGISLENVENARVVGNIIHSKDVGVRLQAGSSNLVKLNLIEGANNAVRVIEDSNLNTIKNNTILDNIWEGILVIGSHENVIEENQVSKNKIGLLVYGQSSGLKIISNQFVNNSAEGINIENSTETNVSGNLITGNFGGLIIEDDAVYNTISENIVTNNNWTCIGVFRTDSNNILNNQIAGCGSGITIAEDSNNHFIKQNNITNSYWEGIHLGHGIENIIDSNTLSQNSAGLILSDNANSNTVTSNHLVNNGWIGASLYNSTQNLFYANNFSSNGQNAEEDGYSGGNFWNQTLKGNYWDDYQPGSGFYEIPGPGDGVDWHPTG